VKSTANLKRMYLVALGLTMAATYPSFAQTNKPEFKVASVKQSRTGEKSYTNFPLGPGPEYKLGGYLVAVNMPLLKFIEFAYKPTNYQIGLLRSEMPSWSSDIGFDIEARADGNPSKDDMRLMMQSLLATRFHMVVHYESREAEVFALTLLKKGKIGPQLKPHSPDDPICTRAPLPQNAPDGNPAVCGVSTVIHASAPNLFAVGGHNVSIPKLAMLFPGLRNNVDRPVLDETGLTGTFDYSLEWSPETDRPTTSDSALVAGPTFVEALREQLGLKLIPGKGRVDVIVVDHIEHPSGN
jgi:uncharacterized protein (TIGR03435 family)